MSRSAALLLLPLVLAACRKEPEVWTAFVYPPGQSFSAVDPREAVRGTFPTFVECQAQAIWLLRNYREGLDDAGQALAEQSGWGDYECGLDCRREGGSELYMCKETRK